MRGKARTDDSGDERGIWDSVESQKLIRSKQRKGGGEIRRHRVYIQIFKSKFSFVLLEAKKAPITMPTEERLRFLIDVPSQ